jgi:tetratricopeptide (TPR) repeat protein
MRGKRVILAAVAAALLVTQRARAGLYSNSEAPFLPFHGESVQAVAFPDFRDKLIDYLRIGVELNPVSARRRQYLQRRDQLLARERAGRLTTAEAVDLSESLIRLRQYEDAVQLLTPLAVRERGNFMVLANLATAHQLAGRLDRALGYLEQVDAVWPERWPGLSTAQLKWYRLAEKYQLRLVRSRLRANLSGFGKGGSSAEQLDTLFVTDAGPVQFRGESGGYQAGTLAASERAKLPPQAVALVQQLLVWLPGAAPGMEDTRLYWLLGELYNADGDVTAASQILEKCVWSHRFDAPLLREHRQIVQAARPQPQAVTVETAPVAAEPKATWIPDRRKLLVGGGLAALIVAALVYLQIRELRRRRRAA